MSTPSAALATHGRHPHAQLVSSYPSTSHIYPNHNSSSSSNGVTYTATNANTSAPATSMSTFAAAPATASLGGNTTTVRGFDARDGHDQAPYSATLNDYAERDAELLGQRYPMATTQAPATTVQAPPHSAAAAAVPDTTDLLRQHYDGSIAETTLPPPQYLYQYMNLPAP
ncbi:hypothetical protein KEM55_005998 [Ascosphaera atra]|nr:hypothetical protein KEM55_005998 [Ascosphaera atra]